MSNVFQSKRALKIYGICALGVTAVCVLLRLLCILFFFDSDIGYYVSGAPLPIILNVLLILAVAAAIVFCLIPRVRVVPVTPTLTASVKKSAVFPAVGFAAYAVVYFTWLADYASIYGTLPFSYILTAITTLCACAFFCLIVFRKSNSDLLYVLTGIMSIVWLVISLAECYFDTLVQMNSPNKLIFQFAALGGMLLLVNELRQGFEFKRPGFHLFSASVASLFLLNSSVPSIICSLTGDMPKSYSLIYSDAVLLLLAVFAVVRLIGLCFGEEVQEETMETEATAHETERVVEEAQNTSEAENTAEDATTEDKEELTEENPEKTTEENV